MRDCRIITHWVQSCSVISVRLPLTLFVLSYLLGGPIDLHLLVLSRLFLHCHHLILLHIESLITLAEAVPFWLGCFSNISFSDFASANRAFQGHIQVSFNFRDLGRAQVFGRLIDFVLDERVHSSWVRIVHCPFLEISSFSSVINHRHFEQSQRMPYTANHPNRAALLNLVQQHRQNGYNSAFRGKASTRILSDTTVEDDEIDSWYADAQAANSQPPPNNVDELWVDLRDAIVPPVQTAASPGPLWGSTGLSGSSSHLDQLIDRKVAEKMGEFMSQYSLAFLHIWTESVITELELGAPKRFKKALIVDCNAKSATRKGYLKCQMTGEEHYKGDMNAAHILPQRAVAFLPVFGLKTDDINSVRNGLLLCRGIERAFDQQQVAEKMGEFMSRYSLAFSHIWTESVITEPELGAPKRFKKALIVDRNAKSVSTKLSNVYVLKPIRPQEKGYLKCQMTGEEHYKGYVNAAHILPERAVAFLPVFGLKTDDINSVRNGLLLCRGIERAFDQQQICFIDAGPQGLILMVLDNNIRDDEAEPSRKKFSELEFETLSTPGLYSFKSLTSENLRIIGSQGNKHKCLSSAIWTLPQEMMMNTTGATNYLSLLQRTQGMSQMKK
ncbi:hypothetical protein PROFUN_14916 [Planoprotostelium fungivorum]|uniref:HNH nuclease domain-containing protein n=1 Tax=Planoprotostelium fungivorum TaxID=1890364 RepID=A0A2P6MY43_9EUKA|nr:hypothetical protein PROFUN_14916 [Planoprotostelium fungivorum]